MTKPGIQKAGKFGTNSLLVQISQVRCLILKVGGAKQERIATDATPVDINRDCAPSRRRGAAIKRMPLELSTWLSVQPAGKCFAHADKPAVWLQLRWRRYVCIVY